MKALAILQRFDFGSDVAETDDRLKDYFIETADYFEIIHNRFDIILGTKGSGKSAIFRRLADDTIPIATLADVDLLPAFNTQGNVVFRRLAPASQAPPKEREAALIWYAYISALVGNHFVRTYSDVLPIQPISDQLREMGLYMPDGSPDSYFERIISYAARLLSSTALEGEFALTTGPVKMETKGKLIPREAPELQTSELIQADFELLLGLCCDLLKTLGRRCWVVFDRLDEAFYDIPDLEAVMLRGLLRTKIDLDSFGADLMLKAFLRTDVIDRVTRSAGFVNATHLRRLQLQWDPTFVRRLIVSRIAVDRDIRRRLGIRDEDRRTEAGQKRICRRLFPDHIDNLPYLEWVLEVTTDASDFPNPRNIIALLDLARRHQIRREEGGGRTYRPAVPLILDDAWKSAARELSFKRFDDTILAEASSLRPALERMRGRAYRYTKAQLAQVLNEHPDSDQFKSTVDQLKYFGVLREDLAASYEIPRLYRPALALTQSRVRTFGRAALPAGAKSSLEQEIKELIETMQGSSGEETRTRWLLDAERRFVHEEVASRYQEYETASGPLESGRKQVYIRLRTSRFHVDNEDVPVTERKPEDLVNDDVLAELYGLYEEAIEKIRVHGQRWVLTPPLYHNEANILASLARERAGVDNEFIRVVGMLVTGNEDRQCIFMKDLPFQELNQQDVYTRTDEGKRALIDLVEGIATVSKQRSLRCEVRPMTDRMTGVVAGSLAERDIEFRYSKGSSTRIIILPDSVTNPRKDRQV